MPENPKKEREKKFSFISGCHSSAHSDEERATIMLRSTLGVQCWLVCVGWMQNWILCRIHRRAAGIVYIYTHDTKTYQTWHRWSICFGWGTGEVTWLFYATLDKKQAKLPDISGNFIWRGLLMGIAIFPLEWSTWSTATFSLEGIRQARSCTFV